MNAPLPRVVDRYELLEIVGSGAFAKVYRAQHVHTRTEVAVKLLEAPAAVAAASDRWLAEVRAMAAIDHPNVVRILDGGRSSQGEAFLVMELSPGLPLRRWLREHPTDLAGALGLCLQLLDGVAAVHAKGIVHRDVKPANVLVENVDGRPRVKLLDFGVSKVPSHDLKLTLPGMVMGTPGYMAPELVGHAATADARADLYAVACIMFELVSGQRPFEGKKYEEFVVQIRTQDPPPLASLAPSVPKALADVIDRGLCRDRESRFPSAVEMATALRSAVATELPPDTERTPRASLEGPLDRRAALEPTTPAPHVANAASCPPPPPDASSRPLAVDPPPPTRSRGWVGLLLALVVVAGIASVVLVARRRSAASHAAAATTSIASDPASATPEPRQAVDSGAADGGAVDEGGSSEALAPEVDEPLALGSSTAPLDGGTSAEAGPRASRRGITYIAIPSVTNHVSDASLTAFARAVTPRAQLCRPVAGSSPTTVEVELLVHDGEIGVAHAALGNRGDKLVAQCVAGAYKEISDAGGRLAGDGIVQVLVTLEPR